MFSISIQVSASNNDGSISEIMENEIAADEIPENVVPLQFDTIEDAVAYLEDCTTGRNRSWLRH